MTQRFPLNLASEPFRQDRPILIASLAVAGLLVLLLAGQAWIIVAERAQAADARQALAALEAQRIATEREQNQVNQVLRRPENSEVIERTIFLNSLLQRKGVSWTRIFGDLETVVPHNVRLTSVRPQINNANQIQLDLLVAAEDTQPVIDLLMRMEASPLFGKTAIANWLPPSQTEPLYRYRLTVNYAQKL